MAKTSDRQGLGPYGRYGLGLYPQEMAAYGSNRAGITVSTGLTQRTKPGDNVASTLNGSVRLIDSDTDAKSAQELPPRIRDFLMYEVPDAADLTRMKAFVEKYGEQQIMHTLIAMRRLMSVKTYGESYPELKLFKRHRVDSDRPGRVQRGRRGRPIC